MLLLETVINRYLALDPEVLEKMAAFDNKVIKVEFTGLAKELYLFPNASGMQISTEYDAQPDTVLRGSTLSIFKMGLISDVASMLLKGEVEISGDTRLGHQFKNIFAQMDIDWSEPLSDLFGETMAYQTQQAVKGAGLWAKQARQSVSTSVSEYLQEESRDVVTETELHIFNRRVDRLRDDVDRLQAKLNNFRSEISTVKK